MTSESYQEYLVRRINPTSNLQKLAHFPSFFEIETVHDCNARCRMCPALKNGREKQCMSDSLFKKIIEEIAPNAASVRRVNLFRDGEPLLDPALEDRVQMCKEAGIDCVSVTSNMSLTTPDRAEKLLQAGLDMLDMSIDGFSRETFEYIRCGLKYTDVLNNALSFVRMRDAMHASCKIRVRMVLQESNLHEWKDFSAFWSQQLGPHDIVMNRPIHNWGNQLQHFTSVNASSQKQVPCVALWSLMPIFADGTVPLCNVDFDAQENLGNVQEQNIAEIWTSAAMQGYRNTHFLGHRDAMVLCNGCNAWDESNYIEVL